MTGTELVGGAQFARTMHGFADDVTDLSAAHTRAGAELVRLVQGRARRLTGRLAASFAASVSAAGVSVSSPVVYFGVQELGWPRRHITPSYALTSSLDDSAGAVETIYEAAVDAAMGKVQGK